MVFLNRLRVNLNSILWSLLVCETLSMMKLSVVHFSPEKPRVVSQYDYVDGRGVSTYIQ